jgi:hypothetical protein
MNPQPPSSPRRSGSEQFVYRVLPAIGAGGLALFGVVAAIAGILTFAFLGSDGTVTTGKHDVSTPTHALVSDVAEIDGLDTANDVIGNTQVRLTADGTGGKGVFVGVARKADVDRYLAGTQIDRVTDVTLDPFRLDRKRIEGSATPAPPARQSFWVASATGTDKASLKWKVHDGDYRFVVMNADGSRHVAADGNVGVKVPHLPGIAAATGIGGLLMAAMGIFVLVVVLRDPRDRDPRAPVAPNAPGSLSPVA